MRSKKSMFFAILTLILSAEVSMAAEKYVIETSSALTPYSIVIDENGENKGLVLEIVLAAMHKAGLEVERPIANAPWKRAQELGRETANSLLFTYARTPARETTVKWITPVINETVFLYTPKDAPTVSSMDDIKKMKSIGVLLGGAIQSRMKDWGLEDISQTVPDEENNAKKLAAGRLDGWISQRYMAIHAIHKANVKSDVKENFKIADVPLWVATSLSTPDENVEKVRKAIEDFKKTPDYEKILAAYN